MTARLLGSHEISPEVRHFRFDVPGQELLSFTPGQFVSFNVELDGKNLTRAYSIASPPAANRFDLVLNRVREGRFSPHLFDLASGAQLDVKGPYGVFVFRKPIADSIMVATGTGIGPFRSMLMSQLPHDSEHRFTLIFGVRHEDGVLYREEFEALARDHPNFTFLPTVSRPGPGWAGLCGRVQPHVMATLGDRRDMDVYICGLKEMVDEMRAQLKAAEVDRKHVIFEKYD
ncbi:MAG: FAD-dependent oxidoreductase [Acidobacteriota bacterium]|nr:FAD-dependent oxidoreductase [Acidobacteriota bacterium]